MHVDCTDPREQGDDIPHESISPDRPFSQTARTHPVNSNSDETDVTHGKLIKFFTAVLNYRPGERVLF